MVAFGWLTAEEDVGVVCGEIECGGGGGGGFLVEVEMTEENQTVESTYLRSDKKAYFS
jgi:hypothetical protein